MYVKALFLVCFVISKAVFAGGNVENGGDAIEKTTWTHAGFWYDTNLYSLDLVEFGLETHPLLDDGLSPDPETQKLVSDKLEKFSDSIRSTIIQKLTRIKNNYPFIFLRLAQHLRQVQIIFIDSELQYFDDTESPLKGKRVRLASHTQHFIRINQRGFDQMVENNKPALLLHELFYMAFPEATNSRRARECNAFFFDGSHATDELSDRYEMTLRWTGSDRADITTHWVLDYIRTLVETDYLPQMWSNTTEKISESELESLKSSHYFLGYDDFARDGTTCIVKSRKFFRYLSLEDGKTESWSKIDQLRFPTREELDKDWNNTHYCDQLRLNENGELIGNAVNIRKITLSHDYIIYIEKYSHEKMYAVSILMDQLD